MTGDILILVDPVGVNEIAERLGVETTTVRTWQSRAKTINRRAALPDPKAHRTGTPLWEWETIRAWAEETGRLEQPA